MKTLQIFIFIILFFNWSFYSNASIEVLKQKLNELTKVLSNPADRTKPGLKEKLTQISSPQRGVEAEVHRKLTLPSIKPEITITRPETAQKKSQEEIRFELQQAELRRKEEDREREQREARAARKKARAKRRLAKEEKERRREEEERLKKEAIPFLDDIALMTFFDLVDPGSDGAKFTAALENIHKDHRNLWLFIQLKQACNPDLGSDKTELQGRVKTYFKGKKNPDFVGKLFKYAAFFGELPVYEFLHKNNPAHIKENSNKTEKKERVQALIALIMEGKRTFDERLSDIKKNRYNTIMSDLVNKFNEEEIIPKFRVLIGALIKACEHGDIELIKEIKDLGGNLLFTVPGKDRIASFLHAASSSEKMNDISLFPVLFEAYYTTVNAEKRFLYSKNAKFIDLLNIFGQAPLHIACKKGFYNIVRYLVPKTGKIATLGGVELEPPDINKKDKRYKSYPMLPIEYALHAAHKDADDEDTPHEDIVYHLFSQHKTTELETIITRNQDFYSVFKTVDTDLKALKEDYSPTSKASKIKKIERSERFSKKLEILKLDKLWKSFKGGSGSDADIQIIDQILEKLKIQFKLLTKLEEKLETRKGLERARAEAKKAGAAAATPETPKKPVEGSSGGSGGSSGGDS